MVLSKRFSKDISSVLPSVEEAKDAEEEETSQISLGGIPSRPPSRPLAKLSRGSVDSKTVQKTSRIKSEEDDENVDAKSSGVQDQAESEALEKGTEEQCAKPKEKEEDWDTDLEIEEVKESYDPTGKARYLSACQYLGVVPVSYFLRHMQDSDLVMRHHGLGLQAVKALALSLVTNTSIVRLDLSDNWLEGDGAAAIADMLKENCYISEIYLSGNKLGLKGAKALSLMLVENTTLRKIGLSGNEFNDQAAPYISDAFMNNQKLESVDLSHNMFGDGSGEILGTAISENTGILELNLNWNNFRGKGAVALAKGIGANIFIRVLDLSYNGFGNDGAAALGEALKVNNVLEELNISNNRISLQGAVRFALCLKENKVLKVLKMSRNPMKSEGCFAILKSVQANSESAIECLDFSDIIINKEFDDLCNSVKTTMPNLSVKHGGSSEDFKRSKTKADPVSKVRKYIAENNLQLAEWIGVTEDNTTISMTHEEFQHKLMSNGISMAEDEVQNLIDFLDKDKSGAIDFSAFQRALSS
ncbi:leucine-rich repeat-containing protein 74B-like [Spea bombifrons]|uniref:leucine-rich repeat-containing protein 74B-like n=1 Tax=Spea bombifrons TaxID=233779 RepID=UPI0023495834|nr:leucine-rich repeat-containing protein 74B-like [Spea bombifrons]